ncbi:hypothetical protein VTL71DRAFT_12441 [Oculimacula yallundae]|uniref:Uncharacterized protein n=1 Tax=Oculimacula yallundae TaxID=86028 RepID=A0ABR4CPR3_9HELO
MEARRDPKPQNNSDSLLVSSLNSSSRPLPSSGSSPSPRPQSSLRRRSRSPLSRGLAGSKVPQDFWSRSLFPARMTDIVLAQSHPEDQGSRVDDLPGKIATTVTDLEAGGLLPVSLRMLTGRQEYIGFDTLKWCRLLTFRLDLKEFGDFYHPPRSHGFAPGDTPLRYIVRAAAVPSPETSEYEPSYQDKPTLRSSHKSKDLVPSEDPRSKDVQASVYTKSEPIEAEETLVGRISAVQDELLARILLARSFGNRLQTQNTSTNIPSSTTGSNFFSFNNVGSIPQPAYQPSISDVKSSKGSGSDIFSIHDEDMHDENLMTPWPNPSNSDNGAGAPSFMLENSRSLPAHNQQLTQRSATGRNRPPVVDAATSRRLFGGIIKFAVHSFQQLIPLPLG